MLLLWFQLIIRFLVITKISYKLRGHCDNSLIRFFFWRRYVYCHHENLTKRLQETCLNGDNVFFEFRIYFSFFLLPLFDLFFRLRWFLSKKLLIYKTNICAVGVCTELFFSSCRTAAFIIGNETLLLELFCGVHDQMCF